MSKQIFILGDSYSTYRGYIPEGYNPWYCGITTYTDVSDVSQCWWAQLKEKTGMNIVRNDSWSGTTICHTGYNGDDYHEISLLGRFEKLVSQGFFKENRIDTFLIFGGTNDSWANDVIGEIMYDGQTNEDLYHVLPAACMLMKRIKEELPDAAVYSIINCELKDEIMDGIEEISKHYGAIPIRLHNVEKINGHPSKAGMTAIYEQVYAVAKDSL